MSDFDLACRRHHPAACAKAFSPTALPASFTWVAQRVIIAEKPRAFMAKRDDDGTRQCTPDRTMKARIVFLLAIPHHVGQHQTSFRIWY
jgi:hypothetical protein